MHEYFVLIKEYVALLLLGMQGSFIKTWFNNFALMFG